MSKLSLSKTTKHDEESKSTGNIQLTITSIGSNTNLLSQKKTKKIADTSSSGDAEHREKEKEKDNIEKCEDKTSKPLVVEKVHNSLAVVPNPSSIPYIETPWTIIGAYSTLHAA